MADNLDEIKVPKILPASDDGVFKVLMTHPDANAILRSVISSTIDIPVDSVSLRNNELAATDTQEKDQVFDVNCVTGNKEQIAVEMSSHAMEGDSHKNNFKLIRSRSVYELCYLHSTQPSKGINYDGLARSFQVVFCDYTVFTDKPDFIRRCTLKDETGIQVSDDITLVFVELPKVKSVMKKAIADMTKMDQAVKEMTDMEKWAIFLGYFHHPKYSELVAAIIDSKEEIKMASQLLTEISQDERQRALFRSRRIAERDREHFRVTVLNEGIEKGKKENAQELLSMFEKGYSPEEIQKRLKEML
jgi:predicted transposase/invertase (TIGR01784 family)